MKPSAKVIREIIQHAVCLALFPLAMTYLSEVITLQSFSAAWRWMTAHADAAFAFSLFLAAFSLFLRAVLRSYALSTLLCALPLAIVTLVNYYKTVINGFPLMLSDFTLFSGMGDIISYAAPKLQFSAVTVWALVLYAALVLLAAFFCRTPRLSPRVSFLAVGLSLPLLLSCLGSGVALDRAAALAADCSSQEERLDRCGVAYGLYAAYAAGESADYSAYSADTLNRLQNMLYLAGQESAQEDTQSVRPHIFLILSESFFDVTQLKGITFTDDPLPNFHALSAQSTNGSFLSSTYAGGTGNVELEVLTGFGSDLLKTTDAITSLPADVYSLMPSAARDARDNGYETLYLHSHTPALYRRTESMPALGFADVCFIDDFETPPVYDGAYISDEALVQEVKRRFEERDPASPVFMQITTMENHQPYNAQKYDYRSGLRYETSLEGEALDMLDALLIGLHHSDAALGELVDYFSQCDEPVMLVFYGDHRPSLTLSDNETIYSKLGVVSTTDTLVWSSEEIKEMLSTDYLIWTNYETESEPDHTSSSILLGADVMRRAGLKRSAYSSWLSRDAAAQYLVSRPRLFVAADGTPYHEAPESLAPMLDAQRMMQYDLIYGEQRLTDFFRISS